MSTEEYSSLILIYIVIYTPMVCDAHVDSGFDHYIYIYICIYIYIYICVCVCVCVCVCKYVYMCWGILFLVPI